MSDGIASIMRAHRQAGRDLAEREFLRFEDLGPLTAPERETLIRRNAEILRAGVRDVHLKLGIDSAVLDAMMLRHASDGFVLRLKRLGRQDSKSGGPPVF